MNLKDARENYYYHTGKASDLVRQLGLAGIAIVWIFKDEQAGQMRVPAQLFLPSSLIVIGLGLDLLQYVSGSVIWGGFHRVKERSGISETEEIKAPRWINWPTIVLFWIKITIIGIGYVMLIKYLVHRIPFV